MQILTDADADAVTPKVTYVGAYYRPSNGNFFQSTTSLSSSKVRRSQVDPPACGICSIEEERA